MESLSPDEIRALLVELHALREEVLQLRAENAELREKLGKNPRNSSRPPSSEHPHAKPNRSKRTKRKRGGQNGHPRNQRDLIPTEDCTTVRVITPTQCEGCGETLSGTNPEPLRHQVTDLPPIQPTVTEYQRHTLTCTCCGKANTPPLPSEVPRGRFGPNVIALIAVLSPQFRLSKRQIQTFLESVCGLSISTGQICKLQRIASQAIERIDHQLRTELSNAVAVHMDETPWREGEQKAWLWGAESTDTTLFSIRDSRKADVIRELLGQFEGVVISDRYSGYDTIELSRRQLCWAHLLRDFQAMIDRGDVDIGLGLRECAEQVFREWRRFQEHQIVRQTLQRNVSRIQGRFYGLMERGIFEGRPKTRGTCNHIFDRYDGLWTFADIEQVEPSNNAAERALRSSVIWRKLSFGTASTTGSRYAERFLSLIATGHKRGKNVLEFVRSAIEAHLGQKPVPRLA